MVTKWDLTRSDVCRSRERWAWSTPVMKPGLLPGGGDWNHRTAAPRDFHRLPDRTWRCAGSLLRAFWCLFVLPESRESPFRKSMSYCNDLDPQIKKKNKKNLPSKLKLAFELLEKISDTELTNPGLFGEPRAFRPRKHLGVACPLPGRPPELAPSIRRCFFWCVVLLVLMFFTSFSMQPWNEETHWILNLYCCLANLSANFCRGRSRHLSVFYITCQV